MNKTYLLARRNQKNGLLVGLNILVLLRLKVSGQRNGASRCFLSLSHRDSGTIPQRSKSEQRYHPRNAGEEGSATGSGLPHITNAIREQRGWGDGV